MALHLYIGYNERILDRLIDLEPDQPSFRLRKADSIFAESADLKVVRAVYETLPPSVKDDPKVTADRGYYAMCARDFTAAEELSAKLEIKRSPSLGLSSHAESSHSGSNFLKEIIRLCRSLALRVKSCTQKSKHSQQMPGYTQPLLLPMSLSGETRKP